MKVLVCEECGNKGGQPLGEQPTTRRRKTSPLHSTIFYATSKRLTHFCWQHSEAGGA